MPLDQLCPAGTELTTIIVHQRVPTDGDREITICAFPD